MFIIRINLGVANSGDYQAQASSTNGKIRLGKYTCLLRNLYAGQEATVRTGHGTTDWFQIGKGVRQGCIFHSAYLTYMQSTS